MKKVLKVLGTTVAMVILLVSSFLLLISFTVTGVVQDSVSSLVVGKLNENEEFKQLGIKSETIVEITKNDEVMDLVEKYVSPMLGDEYDDSTINIGKDILEFVTNNKEYIESIVGKEIDLEEVEEFTSSEDMTVLNDKYRDMVIETSGNVPVEVKNMVYTYAFFFTDTFRWMMVGVMIGCVVMLGLIQKSWHKWMKLVGGTLIGCGVVIGVFSVVASMVLTGVLKAMDMGVISFDYTNGLICAGVAFVVGLILVIVYSSIEKRRKERSILNEISTVS